MKRVEREVNRITSAIIGTALRVLLVVVIAFLVCEGAAKGYRFGYRIFVPPEQIGTAVTKTIVVEEGEPLLEIAENLEKDGKGHSVSFHTDSEEHIAKVAESLCVSRFVINQCSSNSAGGSYFNGLNPTNTLGCGSWGHNSISENLNYTHLMNVSRVARFMPDNYVPTDEELWG